MELKTQEVYQSPLSIHFVWCPSDEFTAKPIVDIVTENFSRHADKPFSRSINLPIFYYSASNGREVPKNVPLPNSKFAVIFVFTSVNTAGNDLWRQYVESLSSDKAVKIVPVALDRFGLNHEGALNGLNCVRAYEWNDTNLCMYGLLALSHEIFRHGFDVNKPNEQGICGSLKLFLSHSKHDEIGLTYVDLVKDFIDNSSFRRFFDATEIVPGYSFSEEINKHICDSTLVAFLSDSYSSRYWCQKEVLGAKEHERPILIVNCLSEFEDRVFPASSNVPCLTVKQNNELDENEVLKILSTALTETIRYQHSLDQLQAYKDVGWFDDDTYLMARPPEIRKMLKLKQDGVKQVCYPEPPVYSDEADWHVAIGVEAITPLWDEAHMDFLKGLRVGLSISDINEDFFSQNHIHPNQLIKLAQVLARHLLARSSTLVYGGDLRKNGFTEFIINEAHILSDRLKTSDIKLENHLAWPLYLEDIAIKAWRAQHHKVMKTVEHAIPKDVSDGLANDVFILPTTPQNAYVWSRCLTQMRERVVDDCDYRICAGGKASGFKGKMAGVLEEIMIALDKDKPLFLLGGLNGIVGDTCSLILTGEIAETFTERWQIANNSGYAELQDIARKGGNHCDYIDVVTRLQSVKLSDLAKKVNLTEEEYKVLMQSPYAEECLHIILKAMGGAKPQI